MAAYVSGWWQGLPTAAIQTCAFAAWIVGHVVLAFTSRSEHQWILRHGFFTNRVLNFWALAAMAFLLAAAYLPVVGEALHLQPVPPAQLAIVVVIAGSIVALAELRKLIPPTRGLVRA